MLHVFCGCLTVFSGFSLVKTDSWTKKTLFVLLTGKAKNSVVNKLRRILKPLETCLMFQDMLKYRVGPS